LFGMIDSGRLAAMPEVRRLPLWSQSSYSTN